MAVIDRFEDLKCWQEARKLVMMSYSICKEGTLQRDFDTSSQLKRAALSIMNNVAEGFGRKGRDFVRFLEIAQSSAMEVKSISYVLEDLQLTSPDDAQALRLKAEEVKSLILGLMRYLKSKLPTKR